MPVKIEDELRAYEAIDSQLGAKMRADYSTYEHATRVTATLDSRLATELANHAVRELADLAKMSPVMMGELLHFIAHDPEIGGRFQAHVAAQRMNGNNLNKN